MNGYTKIAIAKHGIPVEIQDWPNVASDSALRDAMYRYGANLWNTEIMQGHHVLTLHVSNMQIIYMRGSWDSEWVLRQVTGGASLPSAPYFDGMPPSDEENPSHEALALRLLRVMPGLKEIVRRLCDCEKQVDLTVWSIVQHLNDDHHPSGPSDDKWTRERIAQWTEELPFDLTIDAEAAERAKRQDEYTKQAREHMKIVMEPTPINPEFLQQLLGKSPILKEES